jgi:NADH-quinone oxidoreductase subunit M
MLNEQGWLLTVALFLPLLGAAVLLLIPAAADRLIKRAAVVLTGVSFAAAALVTAGFDFGAGGEIQYETTVTWIEAIGARYHLGIDGISVPLFFLTYLLTFLCAIYTTKHMPEPGKPKSFLALMMLLQTGMAGTFVAFDLMLFFVFWELVLVPMYFMIGIWGGPRREYASVKFFLYTLFGSVFMLVAFLSIYFAARNAGVANPWDIIELSQATGLGSRTFQTWAFLGIFLGFAIKVPMWPFHTWLPDAHTEAPTVGSVLLAGVLLKMGTYGFIRIAPADPARRGDAVRPADRRAGRDRHHLRVAVLLAQSDVKRLIAFSSVGHMGFVMLGIASMNEVGIQAALYGNIAHGVVTGMLFFLAGSLHERYHTRDIATIGGGMLVKMPRYGALLVYVSMASLGLPGLAGFWGEFTALWAARSPAPALAESYSGLYLGLVIAGAVGTVLTAGYFLWLIQRVGLGRPSARWADAPLDDVMAIEWVSWLPLLLLILAMGVAPGDRVRRPGRRGQPARRLPRRLTRHTHPSDPA